MILQRVYDLALPDLTGRKIKQVRVGLGLMATELDNGLIGVTYVLRKEADHVCTALPQAGGMAGKPAAEVAGWALTGNSVVAVAMGLAVLNSAAAFDKLDEYINPHGTDAEFAAEIMPGDTVGIVGHIGPLVARLKNKVQRLLIFERGEDTTGSVYPESAQPELLPECQVVFISSTTLINGTLDKLLTYCSGARDVVLVGSSTPLYPGAFTGTGVTVLSGTRWLSPNREAILTRISECAGMRQLIKHGQKILVKVE